MNYTQSEVARKLKVARFTVWRWCRDGKLNVTILPLMENGKEIQFPYIKDIDLQEFLDKRNRA